MLASGGDDNVVRLWEIGSGPEVAVLTGHRSAVACVAFSPDGRLLATAGGADVRAGDTQIRLWPLVS